jgi:hypothetical protein
VELYRLYQDGDQRVDIEERNDLAGKMPEKAQQMDRLLQQKLEAMDASFPYLNPFCRNELPHKDGVCKVMESGQKGNRVWLKFQEQGNRVVRADLIYTTNGGEQYEEWYRAPAKLESGNTVSATLPAGTTHYLFNLVDEHQFLISHPRMGSMSDYKKSNYSTKALVVE